MLSFSPLLFSSVHSLQGQESIQFQDVLCQMIDMVNPKNPQRITIEDMIKPNKRMICGKFVCFVGCFSPAMFYWAAGGTGGAFLFALQNYQLLAQNVLVSKFL